MSDLKRLKVLDPSLNFIDCERQFQEVVTLFYFLT